MLTAADVKNASFARVARGYKMSEVDDLLEQVIDTIEQLTNENAQLLRKLEILADRIQEYRDEEDSIRSALLTAQKSADKILKDANDEKEHLIADARQQADDMLRLSQEKSVTIANETRDKVTQVLGEAKEKASRLLTEAKEKSDSMLTEAVDGCKSEKKYLDFLKEQENVFRQQLIELYKKQFEILKKGPDLIKELDASLAKVKEPVTLEETPAPQPTGESEEATAAPEQQDPVYTEPEDIPLPVAETQKEEPAESAAVIHQGFEVKRKFGDLKFGDDYDIASDDDYDEV